MFPFLSLRRKIHTMNSNESDIYAQTSENDVFSDLLRLLQLDVHIFHNAKICGNWRINEHEPPGMTCFHMVTLGSCLLTVPGHMEKQLNRGDLLIFPREIPHSMTPTKTLSGKQQHCSYSDDLAHEGTGMLCGEVRFQHQGKSHLLDALPAVFVIPYQESHRWMEHLLALILHESLNDQAASKVLLDKLAELLFSYAIREYSVAHPDCVGLLALYHDGRLNKAIKAIHQQPDFHWTLDSLAKQANLSRSIFAEKFKSASGWTAGDYLTWWRMQLAWSQLSQGLTITHVAEHVGYKSEAAFSRVFKKAFAISPGQLRKNFNRTANSNSSL